MLAVGGPAHCMALSCEYCHPLSTGVIQCNVWGQKLGLDIVQVVHEQTFFDNGTDHVLLLDKVMPA